MKRIVWALSVLVLVGVGVGVGLGLRSILPPPESAPQPSTRMVVPAPSVVVDEELSIAARAYGHIYDVLDRDRFSLRSVRCWREADYQLCAVCATGPNHELGATLVKCDHWRCYWPIDVSEYERLGWNGEEECAIRDEE